MGATDQFVGRVVGEADARKARKEAEEKAAEEERLARKRARRAATEKVADIAIAEYGRLIGSCFVPDNEEAAGQAPLRRFMELSHKAEYGTGEGGGGGGGGC